MFEPPEIELKEVCKCEDCKGGKCSQAEKCDDCKHFLETCYGMQDPH